MILGLVAISGLILLSSLLLNHSFSQMKKRTHLFLCTKEAKGELNNYLKLMGRTNWAIKNAKRASLVMLFIPGLQGAAMEVDKVKRMVKTYQNTIIHVSYLKNLTSLARRGCPIDPRMLITPFELNGLTYRRNSEEAAILRESKWNYLFIKKPYALEVKVDAQKMEQVSPKIVYYTKESAVRSLSRWFSSL